MYGYAMSELFPTSRLKWIDPKEFDLNKYTSSSSKGCVLEVEIILNIQKNYETFKMTYTEKQ